MFSVGVDCGVVVDLVNLEDVPEQRPLALPRGHVARAEDCRVLVPQNLDNLFSEGLRPVGEAYRWVTSCDAGPCDDLVESPPLWVVRVGDVARPVVEGIKKPGEEPAEVRVALV